MLLGAPPRSGADIRAALEEVHQGSVAYWATFSDAEFFTPFGLAWAPAMHVRHLSKSIRAVHQGLRLPPFLVRWVFGRAGAASRDYDSVVTVYRARLAQGASAGRFAPSAKPPAADPAAERARIMRVHASTLQALIARSAQWSESDLDAATLPHPLLGPLTVREMLFFTVYHNTHHVANVQRLVARRKQDH